MVHHNNSSYIILYVKAVLFGYLCDCIGSWTIFVIIFLITINKMFLNLSSPAEDHQHG